MGKRFQQYKQKARGRQSLVFAFDIVPYSVGNLLLFSLCSHHAPAQVLDFTHSYVTPPVLLQRMYLHRLAKFPLCWSVAPRCNTLMQQQ